jgi:hypothetical protein
METLPTAPKEVNDGGAGGPSPDKMSDRKLVDYFCQLSAKFLLESRPYLIEIHTRFIVKKAHGKPLLGYTDWDKFCHDILNYTGRHVRRIISGEGFPKKRKRMLKAAPGPSEDSADFPLKGSAVWTNHDFIHRCAQSIKQILKPLESDPDRYAKVAKLVAEEITAGLDEPEDVEPMTRKAGA